MTITVATVMAASGKAGKNATWTLDSKGLLTITGKGALYEQGSDRPFRPDKVKNLVVGDGVTNIPAHYCRECVNLITVDLPSTIESIGHDAFADCDKLDDIGIPYGIVKIGDRAFKNCHSLKNIDMPVTLKEIGKEAFTGCENLESVRLTPGIEKLGKNAFFDCRALTDLADLPQYVTEKSYIEYGLNRSAVRNYWARKEEIASSYGNTSGSTVAEAKQPSAEADPSDVDIDIPYTGVTNANTFVLIIANENYGKLANVPFALHDGNTFALYCKRTLGVPAKNILQYNDASYGSMREAFSDLRLINDVVGPEMKLIFYYAGHGAPDDATLEPYIIPVDAAKVNANVCLPLAQIYREIGEMQLKSATVFLDACFSGATRDGGMVVAARGVARPPKKHGLQGKMAVLSATSGEQTALPYTEKSHGMFTYYLLKRLQETQGNATMRDLQDYVSENVARSSAVINRKDQTPSLNVSADASVEWDTWKLNE